MSSTFKSLKITPRMIALVSSIAALLRYEQAKLQNAFIEMLGEIPGHAVQYQPINNIPKPRPEFRSNK